MGVMVCVFIPCICVVDGGWVEIYSGFRVGQLWDKMRARGQQRQGGSDCEVHAVAETKDLVEQERSLRTPVTLQNSTITPC